MVDSFVNHIHPVTETICCTTCSAYIKGETVEHILEKAEWQGWKVIDNRPYCANCPKIGRAWSSNRSKT